jgi:hypothetical protein
MPPLLSPSQATSQDKHCGPNYIECIRHRYHDNETRLRQIIATCDGIVSEIICNGTVAIVK